MIRRCGLASLCVAALVFAGAGLVLSGLAHAESSSAIVAVSSDPSGAVVYVDGRQAGVTPLELAATPGEHRVRLAKRGYLDNSRVVVIAPGRRTVHNAALTQVETPETPPPAPEVVSKKGGSKLKYIVPAALVAGGGGYLLYSQLTKNSPPVAAGSITPTGTGIAGLTPFTFDGSRSTDPDKDTLTYSWNFGDGQQGTGGSAQHVYATAGSFVVSLAVSDGKATSTASVGTVTVAPSVAGVWDAKLAYLGNLLVYRLTQNGATVGGTLDIMDYYTPTKVLFSAPVSGSLSGTRGYVLPCPITLSASISDFNFTGNYETDRTIVGTSDRYGAGTLTRR